MTHKESDHTDYHRDELIELGHASFLIALAEICLVILDDEVVVARVSLAFLNCGRGRYIFLSFFYLFGRRRRGHILVVSLLNIHYSRLFYFLF